MPRCLRQPCSQRTRLAVVLTFTLFVFLFLQFRDDAAPRLSTSVIPRVPLLERPLDFANHPKIAKISMLYGKNPKQHYIRALQTHRLHNQRFNYAMYVLQEDALGGFWNKPTYLLSLIMQELAKPPGERLQWLMWVDADLLLVNPSIPLEVFLPPLDLDEIHFLGGRDQNGLNTGTFFIRVSAWSVHMLTKALALPLTHPEIDLGNSMDQVSMAKIMTDDYGIPEEDAKDLPAKDDEEKETPAEKKKRLAQFGRPVLFQPREWYNTYEFGHGYEGGDASNGYMLVHFPGMEELRWAHMEKWLARIEQDQATWDVPLNESIYATQVPGHWKRVRESRDLIRRANETLADLDPLSSTGRSLREKADDLQGVMTNTTLDTGPGTDIIELMDASIRPLRNALSHASTREKEDTAGEELVR